jgi:hypothetical protein
MKNIFLIKLIFFLSITFSISGFAQDSFKIKPAGRIYAVYPIQLGDNSLSDGHSPNVGFGAQLYLPKFENFRLGFGGDYIKYSVEKANLIGPIDNSIYLSLFAILSYDITIKSNFNLSPCIGYGATSLDMKSNQYDISPQEGTEFRIGIYGDYNFTKHFACFFGINYISNQFDINTNQTYEDYFGKASSIQFSIGMKFF